MSSTRLFPLMLIAVLCSVLFMAGCGPKQAPDETPTPVAPVEEPVVVAPEPVVEVTEEVPTDSRPIAEPTPTVRELNDSGVLQTVYFDFDKSELSETTRGTLRGNAEWIKANTDYSVVIEGHCDERGTIEYNLALGQRRAQAVRDYLTSLGVTGGTLRIVSFGEEKPDHRYMGSNESDWAKNRRAVFLIEE